VTGDITQVDLEAGQESGLVDAINKLVGLDGIATVELARDDIIRHRLVQAIVDAYEQGDRGREDRSDRRRRRRRAEPPTRPASDTQD
jgi:phosphate starvation-inducible PhoH-like protein